MRKNKSQEKKTKELNIDLFNLLQKQFNLRMQVTSGQLKQSHLLKKIRRDIARIKTMLTLQADSND